MSVVSGQGLVDGVRQVSGEGLVVLPAGDGDGGRAGLAGGDVRLPGVAGILLSLSGWPSVPAVSRVGAAVVPGRAGWPGRPCPSRLQVNMPPCLLVAVILLPTAVACV